jgi:hypothetical protein
MAGRTNGMVPTLAITIGALQPSAEQQTLDLSTDQQRLEVPLGPLMGNGASGAKLFFGSVGVDSRAGVSYVPDRGDDPYYFNIPSKRPAPKNFRNTNPHSVCSRRNASVTVPDAFGSDRDKGLIEWAAAWFHVLSRVGGAF